MIGRIATVHNGNITNAKEIKEKLKPYGLDVVASSDSEIMSLLIAYKILRSPCIETGVIEATKELEGAFSLAILCSENKLIAVRDPHGFRPFCIGESPCCMAVTSESCALDSCGFTFMGDIRPGEMVVIQDGKIVYSQIVLTSESVGICVFEYVYFSRSDSIIDQMSVYEARYNMGRRLAQEHPVEADVVCGVPDTGLEVAIGYARESGIPIVSGFAKNRYIGRSFIFPTQAQGENAVRLKLNPLRVNIEGKRVVVVDDSIVRGTTCAQIILALRNAGANEVHFRVSSPPFRHTCYFGTDIGGEEKLIANHEH